MILETRLQKDLERKKNVRKNETPEQRERRLAKARESYRVKKQNETFEDKEARLDKKHRRQNDQSSEEREERLANVHHTNVQWQLIREVESSLAKQVRLEKEQQVKKAYRQNQSSEKRDQRLESV